MLPCKDCIVLSCCISLLEDRKQLFEEHGPSSTIQNEDSETLLILYYKCSLLQEYLKTTDPAVPISKEKLFSIMQFFNDHWAEGPYPYTDYDQPPNERKKFKWRVNWFRRKSGA
jgi:hypothetical protein